MFRKRKRDRKAAAVVELAICLPVVVLIVLSSIEGASMIFLRQTLVQTSYEAVKAAGKRKGTEAESRSRGNAVLATRDIQDATYTFSFADPDDPDTPISSTVETAERGTLITITVAAPGNQNSVLPFGPFEDTTMRATATMVKE